MRLLALSDLHGAFPKVESLPDARAALVAGDLTDGGTRRWPEVNAAHDFLQALTERYESVFWIPGNHDIGVKAHHWPGKCLLEGPGEIDGQTVAGISLVPCFDLPRLAEYWDHMTADAEMDAAAFAALPTAQIVVSHGPALGALDAVGARHIGSPGLLAYIQRHTPALVVCGHCHEGVGQAQFGGTLVVNTAQSVTLIVLDNGAASVLSRTAL